MEIHWDTVARLTSPVIGAFVGWWLRWYSDRGSKLIAYNGHACSFRMDANDQAPAVAVNTHSVVVRNVGRKTARNVRVSHSFLPNFLVFPLTAQFTKEILPSGGAELIFPTMVPGEQLDLNYIYFPPLLVSQIATQVKSDDGSAQIVTALPTPQPSRSIVLATRLLTAVGALALAYVALTAGGAIWAWCAH